MKALIIICVSLLLSCGSRKTNEQATKPFLLGTSDSVDIRDGELGQWQKIDTVPNGYYVSGYPVTAPGVLKDDTVGGWGTAGTVSTGQGSSTLDTNYKIKYPPSHNYAIGYGYSELPPPPEPLHWYDKEKYENQSFGAKTMMDNTTGSYSTPLGGSPRKGAMRAGRGTKATNIGVRISCPTLEGDITEGLHAPIAQIGGVYAYVYRPDSITFKVSIPIIHIDSIKTLISKRKFFLIDSITREIFSIDTINQ
jgi:hypothetical protein